MRRHREDTFHTTCIVSTAPNTRDDSLCCHVERSDSEAETSRLDGTFTLTNHTRNAQIAETNINDRSRCSIIPRLERGMPAVDGFVTYHSTFSSLDGGAFHPLRAILHTIGRHARSGHAVLSARFHDGRPLNGFHSISFSSSTAHSIRSCRPASFHSKPRPNRKSELFMIFIFICGRRRGFAVFQREPAMKDGDKVLTLSPSFRSAATSTSSRCQRPGRPPRDCPRRAASASGRPCRNASRRLPFGIGRRRAPSKNSY